MAWARTSSATERVLEKGALNTATPRRVAACRSEEHTSELQSRPHLVCRLLLDSAPADTSTLSLHDALPIFLATDFVAVLGGLDPLTPMRLGVLFRHATQQQDGLGQN